MRTYIFLLWHCFHIDWKIWLRQFIFENLFWFRTVYIYHTCQGTYCATHSFWGWGGGGRATESIIQALKPANVVSVFKCQWGDRILKYATILVYNTQHTPRYGWKKMFKTILMKCCLKFSHISYINFTLSNNYEQASECELKL
jgi:hypothetical protein